MRAADLLPLPKHTAPLGAHPRATAAPSASSQPRPLWLASSHPSSLARPAARGPSVRGPPWTARRAFRLAGRASARQPVSVDATPPIRRVCHPERLSRRLMVGGTPLARSAPPPSQARARLCCCTAAPAAVDRASSVERRWPSHSVGAIPRRRACSGPHGVAVVVVAPSVTSPTHTHLRRPRQKHRWARRERNRCWQSNPIHPERISSLAAARFAQAAPFSRRLCLPGTARLIGCRGGVNWQLARTALAREVFVCRCRLRHSASFFFFFPARPSDRAPVPIRIRILPRAARARRRRARSGARKRSEFRR